MAKRKLENKLIKLDDINEPMVLVDGSDTDYVTPSGKIYTDYSNGNFLLRKNFVNKHNGYVYTNINLKGKIVQRRLHRIIAKAYIPNKSDGDIVMHLDNNKQNNTLSNLKWGTISENTKQAFDDGLAENAKGFDDSQSMPIVEFDTEGNVLNIYGSVSIASKNTSITKTGILYQAKHLVKNLNKKPKKGKYFRFLSEYKKYGFVL